MISRSAAKAVFERKAAAEKLPELFQGEVDRHKCQMCGERMQVKEAKILG